MKKKEKSGIITLTFIAGILFGFLINQWFHTINGKELLISLFVHHNEPTHLSVPETMRVDTTSKLYIYTPTYSKIDLVCGDNSLDNDANIILAAEAAFTGEILPHFSHDNIAGNHVSGGVFYKGYECKVNTGTFSWYNDKWYFSYGDSFAEAAKSADNHGMAFSQVMFIHNGQRKHCVIQGYNIYRALCELNGKLCIIESRKPISFFTFVLLLLDKGVKEAIYLDLGNGWYVNNAGVKNQLHGVNRKYSTNHIVFYR